MKTLLRQKDCKIKHNFLITKQLEKKKDERKKTVTLQERMAWGLSGDVIPAIRFTPPACRQTGARYYQG